jgi:hypothetical protein
MDNIYTPTCHRHRARRWIWTLIYSALAEKERALISSCTREAVAAVKACSNARSLLKPGRATHALGANLEHGDIVLDREGDHSMPFHGRGFRELAFCDLCPASGTGIKPPALHRHVDRMAWLDIAAVPNSSGSWRYSSLASISGA